MRSCKGSLLFLCLLCALTRAPVAHAQWAVVDVGAIAQLVQQVQLIEQELSTAQGELQQAQQTYQSMSGGRGMQQLLSGATRNYLPTSLSDLQSVLTPGTQSYGSLASTVQQMIGLNAVLGAGQLQALSPTAQAQLTAGRRSAALLSALAGAVLSASSDRFASLQQLIDAIGRANDQKGALDLQARIAAEQSMLQNDQEKLTALFQAAQAQRLSDEQRAREQIIAGHGSFATRFRPVP